MSDQHNRTLLIVDDEENIISSLKRVFHRDKYKILSATNARKGLEILSKNDVGVIISDQRMPNMTGTEFFSEVKQKYPKSIRIVLSGFTELKSITEAINEGSVYKFFTKPWDDDQLRENIQDAFEYYELEKENERLNNELMSVNKELESINLNLEKRVEGRTRELVTSIKEHNFLRQMVENMPASIFGIRKNGRIAYINEMAKKCFNVDQNLTYDHVSDFPFLSKVFNDAEFEVSWKKDEVPGYSEEVVNICTKKFKYKDNSVGIIVVIIPDQ